MILDARLGDQAQPLAGHLRHAGINLRHHHMALGQSGLQIARKSVSSAANEEGGQIGLALDQRADHLGIGALIAIDQVGGILDVRVAVHQPI